MNAWVTLGAICLYMFAFVRVCAGMPWMSTVYCGIWAIVSQQLLFELWALPQLYVGAAPRPAFLWWLAGGAIFAVGFTAQALTLARWMPEEGRYRVGPRQCVSAIALLDLFEVLLNLLLPGRPPLSGGTAVILALVQVYCVTTLFLQDALFKKSAMRHELQTLNRIWYEQKEQYQLTKENIDLINHKCHDLKHMIGAMQAVAGKEERERYLREMEDSVRIYDAIVQTGNEVLDTVLTEKSLACEARHVTVSCVADGRKLDFMDPVDVYVILGNALDNAMESVHACPEERRMIDVLVCAEREFLVIRVVNPMAGELTFVDGLPLSTKAHDGYHGFGLKSIRHTVEKYGGYTTVTAENDSFTLKILLPLPD